LTGSWHQPVPHWEKSFCTSIGSVPWKKLCETKKLMYMYPTIVEWNDSEGEEAFQNAKARYWAEINHLPCPVALPDPDMYIDNVDYNAALDPEMVEDLYKQPPPLQDEGDKGIVWDSFQFTTETVPVTGWGDEEDEEPPIYATESIQIQPSGWGDEEKVTAIYTTDQSIQIQPTGWGGTEKHTDGINHKDSEPKDNSSDYQCNRDYSWLRQGHRNYEYSRKGHGESYFGSNDTTRRYRGRKKANNGKEQTVCYKNSMPSCGPVNRGGSADYRSSWQWQKSIS